MPVLSRTKAGSRRAPSLPSRPRSGEFHGGEAAARPRLLRPRRNKPVIPEGRPPRCAPPGPAAGAGRTPLATRLAPHCAALPEPPPPPAGSALQRPRPALRWVPAAGAARPGVLRGTALPSASGRSGAAAGLRGASGSGSSVRCEGPAELGSPRCPGMAAHAREHQSRKLHEHHSLELRGRKTRSKTSYCV